MTSLWRDVTNPSTMTSLTLLLRRYYPSIMTSLPLLLWSHNPLYCDVITPSTMTSLPSSIMTPLPPSTMTSLLYYDGTYSLLWRHYPLYYDFITPSIMTSLPDVTTPSTMTSLPPSQCPLYYDVTTPLLWRHYPSTMASLSYIMCNIIIFSYIYYYVYLSASVYFFSTHYVRVRDTRGWEPGCIVILPYTCITMFLNFHTYWNFNRFSSLLT